MDYQGFWSYVHADDDADGERITQLARDVAEQFEMLTGDKISLFLDKASITWGDDWRDQIDSTLSSIAFFIPVLTPRYFMSVECRRELQVFARRATRLGIKDLVLPLFYVNVPALHDDANNDDLIRLIQTFQWEDWREIRFEEVYSKTYRSAVARLALRLVEANRQAERIISAPSTSEPMADEEVDDSPGTIDCMAGAEEALPKWIETLNEISGEIQLVGKIMSTSADEIQQENAARSSFASRQRAIRQVAAKLIEPSERIWALGNAYAAQLHEIDEGFRTIIEGSVAEIERDPTSKEQVCSFFQTVRTMSEGSHLALQQCQSMIDATSSVERISRDLRPTLRRLRQGLTILIDGGKVIDDWVRMIDSSGVACGSQTAP